MYPRISVVIITYKQQDLISRAIDSVLCQKEYGLKEIVISDDCSPDNTWSVLNNYSNKYPEYIRAYRNERNLGIYTNLQRALSYITDTDLVLFLSGDDEYCDGFFKNITDVINIKNINLKTCFSIFCDFQIVDTNGKNTIIRQINITRSLSRKTALSKKLRHLLYARSIAISFETVKKFKPIPIDKGISYAENFFDIQPYLYSDLFYYFPFVGSNYYSSIGVSTTMINVQEYKVLKKVYHDMQGLSDFSRIDVFYLKHLEYKYDYFINKSIISLLKSFCFFILGVKYPVIILRLLSKMIKNVAYNIFRT